MLDCAFSSHICLIHTSVVSSLLTDGAIVVSLLLADGAMNACVCAQVLKQLRLVPYSLHPASSNHDGDDATKPSSMSSHTHAHTLNMR